MLSLTVQWDVLRNMPQAIFWTFLQNEFDITGRIIADQVIQFETLIYIVCKSIKGSYEPKKDFDADLYWYVFNATCVENFTLTQLCVRMALEVAL